MPPPGVIKGSCLCQAIKYEVPSKALGNVLCHCENCKKSSGSSFMANAVYKKDDLNIKSGKDKIKSYTDKATESGNTINRMFCNDCGSTLFIESEPNKRGTIVVATGCCEHDALKDWKPTRELFVKKRLGYLPALEETKKMQSML